MTIVGYINHKDGRVHSWTIPESKVAELNFNPDDEWGVCGAKSANLDDPFPPYFCTLSKGHSGNHVAHSHARAVAVWNNTRVVVELREENDL